MLTCVFFAIRGEITVGTLTIFTSYIWKLLWPIRQLGRILSDYISNAIIEGDYKLGDKLPSDRDLAAKFGVGRTALREALKVLSVLGLIDIRPGQGTFICRNTSNFFLMPGMANSRKYLCDCLR